MWRSPSICIYDWSNWDKFVMQSIRSRAYRTRADFGESPDQVASRLPRKAKLMLVHLDISIMKPFIPDASALIDVLSHRNIRTINCLPLDARKRTVQSLCRNFGLSSVSAAATGPDNEMLIVKTDLNSGGEREQLLSAAQRSQYGLPACLGRMKVPDDYFVSRRADLNADIWNDPTLVVERYVKNSMNRFFRVYVALNSVVISEAFNDKMMKRMGGNIRRFNHFLWREGERIYADPATEAKLPSHLLHTAGVFLNGVSLDYGAIDIMESQEGEFFIVDLNKTPYWGDEIQPDLIEHLRSGFTDALKN